MGSSRRTAGKLDQRRTRAVFRRCQEGERESRVVVEKSVAGADDGLTVAPGIPRNANARGHVVGVNRNAFLDAKRLFGCRVGWSASRKGGLPSDVVAHAVIEREFLIYFPAILREDAEQLIVERSIRLADALVENRGQTQAVRLNGSEARNGERSYLRREAEGTRTQTSEVIHAAVVQRKNLRRRGLQLNKVEVTTELERVRPFRPGQGCP